jgi:hypothetical protein
VGGLQEAGVTYNGDDQFIKHDISGGATMADTNVLEDLADALS